MRKLSPLIFSVLLCLFFCISCNSQRGGNRLDEALDRVLDPIERVEIGFANAFGKSVDARYKVASRLIEFMTPSEILEELTSVYPASTIHHDDIRFYMIDYAINKYSKELSLNNSKYLEEVMKVLENTIIDVDQNSSPLELVTAINSILEKEVNFPLRIIFPENFESRHPKVLFEKEFSIMKIIMFIAHNEGLGYVLNPEDGRIVFFTIR